MGSPRIAHCHYCHYCHYCHCHYNSNHFHSFKLIIDGMRMPPPLPQGHIKENHKGKLNMANAGHELTNNLFVSLLPLGLQFNASINKALPDFIP